MTATTAQLEALLFAHGEPMAIAAVARQLQVSEDEVIELATHLAAERVSSGIVLVQTDDHLQLAVSPTISEDVVGVESKDQPMELSSALSEVLALVAYRGPLSADDIQAIRGVDSRRSLRQLIEWEYVVVSGEAAAEHFDITPAALRHLGVTKRQELPRFAEFSVPPQSEES